MIPKYSEIKNQIKIDIPTGRAIIPDLEFEDHNNIRTPDLADFNDNMAVKNLYRRLLVVDAMNTIIRNANNENISLGDWLYFVDDGSKGLDFYNYIDDETFKDVSQIFIDIIKNDVKDIDDLFY